MSVKSYVVYLYYRIVFLRVFPFPDLIIDSFVNIMTLIHSQQLNLMSVSACYVCLEFYFLLSR